MDRIPPTLVSYVLQYVPLVPLLLAYAAGGLAALIHWRHSRVPSSLVLAAVILLALVTLLTPLGTLYVLSGDHVRTWKPGRIGSTLMVFHLGVSIFDAVGIVLLLVAVFHGRRSAQSMTVSLPPPPPSL